MKIGEGETPWYILQLIGETLHNAAAVRSTGTELCRSVAMHAQEVQLPQFRHRFLSDRLVRREEEERSTRTRRFRLSHGVLIGLSRPE